MTRMMYGDARSARKVHTAARGFGGAVSWAVLTCALAASGAARAQEAAPATGAAMQTDQAAASKKKPMGPATGETAKGESASISEVVVTGTNIKGVTPIAPVITITRQDIDASGFPTTGDLMRSLPEDFAGGQNPGTLTGSSYSYNNQNATNGSTVDLFGLGSDATLALINGHRMSLDGFNEASDISVIPLGAIQRVEVVTDGSSAIYGSDAVAGVVNFILRKDYNGLEASAYYGGATDGGDETQIYSLLGGIAKDRWHLLVNAEYEHEDPITASQRDFTSSAYGPETLLQSQTRRTVFVSGGVDITDKISFSVDGIYNDRESGSVLGATGIYYLPSQLQSPSYNVAEIFEFKLPRDWNIRVIGTEGESHTAETYQEYVGSAVYPGGTTYRNSITAIEANAAGKVVTLPTGDLHMALGTGYREEGFDNTFPGQPAEDIDVIHASRGVAYVYGEALVPLISASATRFGLEDLELSVSGRYEHYSDFGGTANPKVGLRYVPFDGLVIRGTWGRSFQAPSLYQLHELNVVFEESASYFKQPGYAAFVTGGNPNLRPETSKNWTVGADYSPPNLKSLVFSVTYFDIDYTNRITTPLSGLSGASIVSSAQYTPFYTVDPSLASVQNAIASAGQVDNFVGSSFNVSDVSILINGGFVNAESQVDRGVDISYRQNFDLSIGNIRTFANVIWSHLTQQLSATAPVQTISGTLFNVPTFRARSGASWSNGGLSATLFLNYTTGETDTEATPNTHVASWTTLDANLAYHFPDRTGLRHGLAFTLSATNLFDKGPPYAKTPDAEYPGLNYDSVNASAIGRFVALKVTKKW